MTVLEAAEDATSETGVVIVDVVRDELARQLPKVQVRVEQYLEKARRSLGAARAVASVASRVGVADPLASPGMPVLAMGAVIERFQTAAVVLPVTREVRERAFRRSADGRAPAQLGKKDSLADCTIAEAILVASRALPADRPARVFLSANKSDFGQEELRAELGEVHVAQTDRWVEAARLLFAATATAPS